MEVLPMAKIKCTECGTKFNGNFCPNCSAPAPANEKKKKKIGCLPIILILVAILVVAGMGGSDEPTQPTNVQPDSSTNAPAETTTAEIKPSNDVTLAESEIYNANGIVVTVTGISKNLFGYDIAVNITNDSANNVSIYSHELSTNGYMMPLSGIYCNVAAGKKAVETLTLLSSDLAAAGIETIADVAFLLSVQDSDTYTVLDTTPLITLSTSAAPDFVQPVDDSGDILYDANGIRVISKGLKDDLIWDGCLVFYVENNTDRNISVHSENVSVNGYMVDEAMFADLRAQTKCIDSMYLLTLTNIGIENIDQVENIEFTLTIMDDNWNYIASTDIISLSFN